MALRRRRAARIKAALACLVLSSALIPAAADAGTVTTTMGVTMTITSGCTVAVTTAVAFATVSTLGSATTAQARSPCTNTTTYNVGLDQGGGSGATVAARKMTGPSSATITYGLYQNSALTTVFGNTVGTNTVAGTGTGTAQTITVYGQVPSQASPAAGSYADVVNVTVTF
ncbi:MAG: spore coat U domain-containing protein [Pseudomonadota bacterium]|nr:spore coat U domain-containing protein [Pseudomonadota bacterium]